MTTVALFQGCQLSVLVDLNVIRDLSETTSCLKQDCVRPRPMAYLEASLFYVI
jgi:hypothetical protein